MGVSRSALRGSLPVGLAVGEVPLVGERHHAVVAAPAGHRPLRLAVHDRLPRLHQLPTYHWFGLAHLHSGQRTKFSVTAQVAERSNLLYTIACSASKSPNQRLGLADLHGGPRDVHVLPQLMQINIWFAAFGRLPGLQLTWPIGMETYHFSYGIALGAKLH